MSNECSRKWCQISCAWIKPQTACYEQRMRELEAAAGNAIPLGPEHTGHFVQPHVAAHCGGPEHTRATCGGDMYVMYANALSVAGTSHSLSHTWATNCSVLAKAWKQWFSTGINIPATMRGHMWLNKVASVLGP